MEEEYNIEDLKIARLHTAVQKLFDHQKESGAGIKTQELEAAAISASLAIFMTPGAPGVTETLRLAILAGSPRLVATFPRSSSALNLLSQQDWLDHISGHLCGNRPDRVAAAIAALPRGLAVYDGLGLLFRAVRSDRGWWPLLEEIAKSEACFGCFMYPEEAPFQEGKPTDLAAFLRLQVKHFPGTAANTIEYVTFRSIPVLLGLMSLLEINPAQVNRHLVSPELHGLLDRLGSNHGRLEIRSELGTLEDALADISRFKARAEDALPRLGRRPE